MASIKRFEDIESWQKARQLTNSLFERGGNRQFIQFLSNAKGSTGEIKSQLYVALDARFIATQLGTRNPELETSR